MSFMRVRITRELETPALAGLFRPVVLLPEWLDREAVTDRCSLTWSLHHELMHWKLGDPWANLIRGIGQTLFFFHPAAWFVGKKWRVAMEVACDRALVGSQEEAEDYATGLYNILSGLHRRRQLRVAGSLFATRTQIGKRIEMLLNVSLNVPRRLNGLTILLVVVFAAVSLCVGITSVEPAPVQVADPDAFDLLTSADPTNAQTGIATRAPADPFVVAVDTHNAVTKGADAKSADPKGGDTGNTTQLEAHPTVIVRADGISKDYVNAIRRTVASARAAAMEQFGFDMPATIVVEVSVHPEGRVRLFNDGADRFFLTVRSMADLREPRTSGVFHIYGLCHEVAHLALYRPIQERGWMSSAAAEGWADYLGARLVDEVHAREGSDLWPDRYDYLEDGTRRLEQSIARANPRDVDRGARLWKDLFEAVGDREVHAIVQAWSGLRYDPADPNLALSERLEMVVREPGASRWWQNASDLFVVQRERSTFVAHQTRANTTTGTPRERSLDSGSAQGRKSIAGGGHAVQFTASTESAVVTSIRVHGSRYGSPRAPNEDFRVHLCDSEFKAIAEFPFPYSKFARGPASWVTLSIEPTEVPKRFFVCVAFNPTATKGVFLSHDGQEGATSFVGLPGGAPQSFSDGSWMLRATLVEPEVARVWNDATGSFSVQAVLVKVNSDSVTLKRTNGKVITVPINRLSKEDQEFLSAQHRSDARPPASNANPESVLVGQLQGDAQELRSDDGSPAGRRSLPQGFAAAFTAPTSASYLTSIRVHGERYGASQATGDFHVTLCDENFMPIANFPFAYSKFARGSAKWVTLRVKPTKVPTKFVLCIDFKSERTRGVYVSHDADGKGLVGKAGKPAGTFNGGDWMIRATVDQLKKP